MANVLHLFRAPLRSLPMEEIAEVRAVENSGLEGCVHARADSARQVLLVDSETLELMELQPGIIRENIRPGLRRELRGRRGMLCRVIASGIIRRGDTIEKIS